MHWNLSFQPRQFLQFWPFQIVFHPIDSTLQWLLPNLPGTNQKRSCPHKSSPEILITEIHIYNIVKNKEHANAICNDKWYLQCQFYDHSQNSEAWWPYQIVGLIKDDYVSLYFYTMSFSWLKQWKNNFSYLKSLLIHAACNLEKKLTKMVQSQRHYLKQNWNFIP